MGISEWIEDLECLLPVELCGVVLTGGVVGVAEGGEGESFAASVVESAEESQG